MRYLLIIVLLARCAPQDPQTIETPTQTPEVAQIVNKADSSLIPNSPELQDDGAYQGPEGTYTERLVTFMLRPNPAGDWRFLTEGNHEKSKYAQSVETYHDKIIVKLNKNFTQIYGFICAVDQQLMLEDITCGISGGIGEVKVFFKKIGTPGLLDPTLVPNKWTNITIQLHGYDDNYVGASYGY